MIMCHYIWYGTAATIQDMLIRTTENEEGIM